MKIGVLAMQGAFIEHVQALRQLGAEAVELRQLPDLEQPLDGIVLPGGESTVQGKQLALAFHPELDVAKSTGIHEYFVSLCVAK